MNAFAREFSPRNYFKLIRCVRRRVAGEIRCPFTESVILVSLIAIRNVYRVALNGVFFWPRKLVGRACKKRPHKLK